MRGLDVDEYAVLGIVLEAREDRWSTPNESAAIDRLVARGLVVISQEGCPCGCGRPVLYPEATYEGREAHRIATMMRAGDAGA